MFHKDILTRSFQSVDNEIDQLNKDLENFNKAKFDSLPHIVNDNHSSQYKNMKYDMYTLDWQ